jgi:hypothetical protein
MKCFDRRLLGALGLLTLLACSRAMAAGILIPVTDRDDIVYDPTRNLLYITTDSGAVQRYDVQTQTLLTPYSVGVNLNGADITTNGAFLYAGEEQTGATQGIVRKVDLATGTRTNLFYDLGGLEGGVWDIAVMSNGKALVTTKFNGSGSVMLRRLDTSNDTFSGFPHPTFPNSSLGVMQNTHLARSFDRNTVFLAQSNISSGPINLYKVSNPDELSVSASVNWSLSGASTAVSRDGSQVAIQVFGVGFALMDSDLNGVDALPPYRGGVAYSPVQDVLYAGDATMNQIVAFNALTSAELFRLDIGEDIGDGLSHMTLSDDGSRLFLTTPMGVRMFTVPVPEPVSITTLGVAAAAMCLRRPTRRSREQA